MKNKKILLVGGSGYIGSHVAIALIDKGYQPIIFDNFSNSSQSKIHNIEKFVDKSIDFFEGDILKKDHLDEIFTQHNFQGVIHLAALKSVPESNLKYVDYYQNNIGGLINLISEMKKNKVYKLIFSSSATVYGDKAIAPVSESMPTYSNNTYGFTKILGEKILSNTCDVDDKWSAISLRYFNPAGSANCELLSEDPKKPAGNLFPIIRDCFVSNKNRKKTFCIYGNDYETPDGTPIRDFIHVEDLAESHVLALMKLEKEKNYYKAINVGSGSPKTVLQIVQKFEEITNKKIKVEYQARRHNDIGLSYADINLAKNELGFEPKHDLDSICRSTLEV